MHKQILDETIDQLQKDLDEAKAKRKACDDTPARVTSSGLLFNDGTQALAYDRGFGTWIVVSRWRINSTRTPLYLEPCRREDLKAGDWAYVCDSDSPSFSDISHYHLILNRNQYVYVCEDYPFHGKKITGVFMASAGWLNWYKVVE
jgi:hypothetical protein